MLKKAMSVRTAPAAAAACLVWLATMIVLGCGPAETFVVAAELGGCLLIGYGIVSFWRSGLRPLTAVIATVLGFQIASTLYALTRAYIGPGVHLALFAVLVLFGAWRMFGNSARPGGTPADGAEAMLERRAIVSGVVVMLAVGSIFYFSGRMQQDGLTFYGPMARDPIYHLALLQRLHVHLPADNVVVSGFPASSYHFFSDAGLDLIARGFFVRIPDLDVFFRLYPSVALFGLGFLAYWIPARFCASRTAGLIGAALVLFGGELSWLLGAAQTLKASLHPAELADKLFAPWIFWSPVTQLYPLVHRPAYYNGLLIFLSGLACVAGRQRSPRAAWALAGGFWGLMAGFNYTFAVVTGLSVVTAAAYYALRRKTDAAVALALCAVTLALASVPANSFILHGLTTPGGGGGSRIAIEPGVLLSTAYAGMLGFLHARAAILVAGLLIFIVLAYGVKLAGLKSIVRGRGFRFSTSFPAAAVVLAVIVISLAFGLLLKTADGNAFNVILLQPAGPLLALFAAFPLVVWMRRGSGVARPLLIAVLVLVGPVQAVLAFELGYKAVLRPDYLAALQRIGREADPQDVIAFLPVSFPTRSILGPTATSNNFYLAAITGLRNYYTTPVYTARESGRPDGMAIYERRVRTVEKVLAGTARPDDVARLRHDGVRWIVLPERLAGTPAAGLEIWRAGADFTVLRLPPPVAGTSG